MAMHDRFRNAVTATVFVISAAGAAHAQTNPPPSSSVGQSPTNPAPGSPPNEGLGLGTFLFLVIVGVMIASAIYFVISRKRRSVTAPIGSGTTDAGADVSSRPPGAPRNPGITISQAPKRDNS
jgi:hypothetical protein